MTWRVRLFARLRELAGTGELTVDLPAGSTLGDLRRRVAERSPALAGLLARSAVALGGEVSRDEVPLPAEGGEVAFLPPVSGG